MYETHVQSIKNVQLIRGPEPPGDPKLAIPNMRTVLKKSINKGSTEIIFMKLQALWVVKTQTNIATATLLVADGTWAKSPNNARAAPAPKVYSWIRTPFEIHSTKRGGEGKFTFWEVMEMLRVDST